MANSKSHAGEKSQADKFREAAKEVETDDNEKRFDALIKGIAKAPKEDRDDPEAAP